MLLAGHQSPSPKLAAGQSREPQRYLFLTSYGFDNRLLPAGVATHKNPFDLVHLTAPGQPGQAFAGVPRLQWLLRVAQLQWGDTRRCARGLDKPAQLAPLGPTSLANSPHR